MSNIDAKQLATVVLSTLVESSDYVPQGHIYAAVMGVTTLDTFYAVLGALKAAGLVEYPFKDTVKATAKARALPWPATVKVAQPV